MKKNVHLIGLLAGLMFIAGVAHAAARIDLAPLLPDNTIAVIEAPSMPALQEAFERSRAYQMYRGEAGGEVFRALKREAARAKDRVVDPGAVSDEQLRAFANGRVILAAIPRDGENAKSIDWVLVFEHNGDPNVLKALNAGPKPGNARIEKSEQQAGALTITQVRIVREVAAKIPGAKKGAPKALKQVSERYEQYFGPSIGVYGPASGGPVRRVVERLGRMQSGEALRAPAVVSAQASLKPAGQIIVMLDVGRIVHREIAEAKRDNEIFTFNPNAFEVEGVRAAASIDFKPGRIGIEVVVETPRDSRGIARLITLSNPLAMETAELVPSDAIAYSALGYPLGDGWRTLHEVLAQAFPTMELTLQAELQNLRKTTGNDVESGLAGSLGDTFVRFVRGKGKNQAEMSTSMLRIKDEKAFRASLDVLLSYLSARFVQARKEDYLGQPLWGLKTGFPDPNTQFEPEFWIAVADGWFITAERGDNMREAIRQVHEKQPDSLAKRREFKDAIAKLPADRQGEAFVDVGAMARVIDVPKPLKSAAEDLKIKQLMPGDATAFGKLWDQYFVPAVAARTVEGNRMQIEIRIDEKGHSSSR